MAATGTNFIQRDAINRGHDEACTLGFTVRCGQLLECLSIETLRAIYLELHQLLEAFALAPIENVAGVNTKLRQLVLGNVNTAAPRIFAHVARVKAFTS